MENAFVSIAAIVVVSALSACLGIISRQPIVVAYITAGIILGPWGLSLVKNVELINDISHIGVVMLLFLAGIVLHPQRLITLFKKTMLTTLVAGAVCTVLSGAMLLLFRFPLREAAIGGVALLFSSTILVVKLLPTTTLHQQRMGSLCIAVLVAQDLIAIAILLFLNGERPDSWVGALLVPLRGIAGIAVVMVVEQYVVRPLMRRVEYYHEVLLLLALGWCFGVAVTADYLGFSHEIGAFIAGLALARSPIAYFLSEGLKFFRDFFLVLFFFTLGAQINLPLVREIGAIALACGGLLLVIKPLLFRWLFMRTGESRQFSTEIGVRLGQSSEFSLIVAVVAANHALIGARAAQLVQVTAIFTMIISSYLTVLFFPSPLSAKKTLKQD